MDRTRALHRSRSWLRASHDRVDPPPGRVIRSLDLEPPGPVSPVPARPQVRDDRALEGRPLREVVDAGREAVEDEAKRGGVAVVAMHAEPEAGPVAHDVR